MKLTNQELIYVIGGSKLTGTLINAFARGLNTVLEIGRSLGTAISRIASKRTC